MRVYKVLDGRICIDYAGKRVWITTRAKKLLKGFDLKDLSEAIFPCLDALNIHCAALRVWDGNLTLQFLVPTYFIGSKDTSPPYGAQILKETKL